MQIAHLPMTQFWSTDSALRECPSPLGNMLMSEVKAEAVPCLQVGFVMVDYQLIVVVVMVMVL